MDTHVPRHLLLQWHLTERCNLRCAHCYQGERRPAELGLEQLLAILRDYTTLLEEWRRQTGSIRPTGHVTVTGGEPLVHQHLFELLEAIAGAGHSIAVLTNGTLVDAAVARRLASLRPAFVQVSLDGGEATHDAIRGRGMFRRASEGLGHLVAAGLRTQVSFTAHRDNYRELPDVARQCADLGVGRLWADRLVPEGKGAALATLRPHEVHTLFDLMSAAREELRRRRGCRTEVSMRRALQFLVGGGRPYHCTAGDTLLALLPNGDLLPCRRMPVVVGNVLQVPLAALYREAPMLCELRDASRVSRGCERCAVKASCRGGLRCLSYALTGTPFRSDPGCWVARGSCHGRPPCPALPRPAGA